MSCQDDIRSEGTSIMKNIVLLLFILSLCNLSCTSYAAKLHRQMICGNTDVSQAAIIKTSELVQLEINKLKEIKKRNVLRHTLMKLVDYGSATRNYLSEFYPELNKELTSRQKGCRAIIQSINKEFKRVAQNKQIDAVLRRYVISSLALIDIESNTPLELMTISLDDERLRGSFRLALLGLRSAYAVLLIALKDDERIDDYLTVKKRFDAIAKQLTIEVRTRCKKGELPKKYVDYLKILKLPSELLL